MNDQLLYCSESHVLVDNPGKDNEQRIGLGEGEAYQTAHSKTGNLYRACQRQYGRCVGHVFVDANKTPRKVGWVFLQKNPDQKGTLLETWVSVYLSPPVRKTVVVEGTYADLGR